MPILPFKTLQDLEIPLTEMVSGRIGFIHDLFLTMPYEVRGTLPDGDQDLVVLTGKKNRRRRIQELADYPGRVVLVLAPGDASVGPSYIRGRRSLPSNFVAVYTTNNELADKRAISVPLGVRINKLRHLQFVRQNHQGGRKGLLYGNFTLNDEHYRKDEAGTRHIRARLVDRLGDAPWADLDISSEQRDTPADLVRYYSRIAANKFVLSPEGNGIDCYRTWESLYLGAIPVVMASATMSGFEGLPILFTEDYSELSQEYLEQSWSEMSAREFDVDKMLKSYYLLRFLESVSSLCDPRFVCWQVDDSPSMKFIGSLERSSRSASGVLAETPVPPFTGSRDMMTVSDWHVVGGLGLERTHEALKIQVRDQGRRLLEFPLETIAGAHFRLTGGVKPDDGPSPDLFFALRDGSDEIAAGRIETGGAATLVLDFVAKSDRTVLTVSASPHAPRASASLSGLALEAHV